MNEQDSLELQHFYPSIELRITSISEDVNPIIIKLKSQTQSSTCPKCGCITDRYHGTYKRRVQDLPILGKQVFLN